MRPNLYSIHTADENAGVLEEKELKRLRRATLTTRHTVELALVLDYSLYSL